jgi:hypothetical protein
VNTIALTGDLTHGGRFSQCVLLGHGIGSAKDYLVVGNGDDTTGGAKVFNIAFDYTAFGHFHQNWQATFFLKDLSNQGSNGLTGSHLVVLATRDGDPTTVMKLMDITMHSGDQICNAALWKLKYCMSLVADTPNNKVDYYFSLGIAKATSTSFRVASQSTANGAITINSGSMEFVDRSNAALSGAIFAGTGMTEVASTNAKSFVDYVSSQLEVAGTDHTCLADVTTPTAAQKRMFAIINGQENTLDTASNLKIRLTQPVI